MPPSRPDVPSDFTATYMSRTQINLIWTKGEHADTTYIERHSMSSWRRGEGTLIYNDTGVNYQDTGLSPNSHYYYQAWSWNQTDYIFSTSFASADNSTYANQPPIFTLPSPGNGSSNNLLSLSWNISMNDPDGDTFSWTIQCSNKQTNSGTTTFNGTKTLALSGLKNSTSYKVWVNATDPTGSGLYTRKWYTFTTKGNVTNTPPTFGTPSPTNGSTGNLLNLTWSIPISDPNGNTFSWTIQCSNKQTNIGATASNGTKSLSLSGLTNTTSYKIWVNATDPSGSGLYTRRWYTFTTKTNLVNNPPVFGTPSPANGSTGSLLSLTWGIPITDSQGDKFSWTIQCSNGQVSNGTGASNGTKSLGLSGLANSTSYKIWVNATDPTGSGLYTRRWYTFTTKRSGNNPPVFGTPSPANGSTENLMNLTWHIPINDLEGNTFSWMIQCSNGQRSNGTGASNGTKSLNLSGLTNSTSYKIWVNATDPTGSGLYTRTWFTFTTKTNLVNNPPVFGTPSPANSSTGNLLSLSWSILISDPEGDTFSWTIQCSNKQVNNGTGVSNGTKTLSLTGLAFLTTYKVWVNATDPAGSGLFTRRWYTFTTRGNNPPVLGASSPSNGSSGNLLSLSWSIPINDREGDTFSWMIQCSNGQRSNGTGASNGTKSLSLSGLAYSTPYTVWVNATDPTGSGLYTRRWYTFTTKANTPPVYSTPSPANGSTGNPLSLSWNISITDSQGDKFSWTIQCNNGQANNGSGTSNGTKSLSLSGLTNSTSYKIWVNATDPTGSGLYTRKWYIFTTKLSNLPPNKPSQPSGQVNGTIKKDYSYTTSTTDPNGDKVYYQWDWGDGTTSEWLGPYTSGISISTTHNWTAKGSFSIKVKAKDMSGNESSWSNPLPIKIRNWFANLILQILEWLSQWFPNIVPILQQLKGY